MTGILDGYGVLVTGGGSGIGFACAQTLARDGAAVTICGRTEATLADAAARIDGDIAYTVADVTSEADVVAALDLAQQRVGRLTAVVANAGGGGAIAPLHLQETDEFLRVLHLNVLSTFLCVKHAVPRMVDAGGGSFVGMSSIAGHVTHLDFGAYPVAKAGIEQLMRNAADEFGVSGLRFNAVRPGFIATELMDGVPRDSETYASYIDNTPLGDVGRPDDVAELVRFLVGPESRWITGQCINIDGGHSLRRGPDFSSFISGVFGDDVMAGRLPDG